MSPPCTQFTTAVTENFFQFSWLLKLRLKSGFTSPIWKSVLPVASANLSGRSVPVRQALLAT